MREYWLLDAERKVHAQFGVNDPGLFLFVPMVISRCGANRLNCHWLRIIMNDCVFEVTVHL